MLKIQQKVDAVIASLANQMTKSNVNTVCVFHIHQPKLPNGAKKLRKF